MTTVAAKMARLACAAALGVLQLCTAPVASAVTPPVVDASMLPKPGSPVPPAAHRTNRGVCHRRRPPSRGLCRRSPVALGLGGVWKLSRGTGQTVAVIDTGVSRHRLLPHLVPGGDYVSTGDGTDDCDGHGTIVAGIIGAAPDAQDGNAFSGIAPDATIISIRQSSNNFRAARPCPGPDSATSTRLRWRCAPQPTWERP